MIELQMKCLTFTRFHVNLDSFSTWKHRVATSSKLQHYTMWPTCKLNGFPVYIASASRCPISTCAEVLVLGSQINSSPVWGEGLRKGGGRRHGVCFPRLRPKSEHDGPGLSWCKDGPAHLVPWMHIICSMHFCVFKYKSQYYTSFVFKNKSQY